MTDGGEIDFAQLDYRALTLEQRHAVRQAAIRRAHAARAALLRAVLQALPQAVARLWRTRRARRRWKAEIAQLRGLDERALKDVGLARFEIDAVAQSRASFPQPASG